MGDLAGHGPPYARACLIFSLAQQRHLKAYVSGKLALAGIDSRAPASVWLDAIYAIVMEAPDEKLAKVHDQITMQAGRLRPDRDTWGIDPDQVAMTNRITQQAGGAPGMGAAPGVQRGGFGLPTT